MNDTRAWFQEPVVLDGSQEGLHLTVNVASAMADTTKMWQELASYLVTHGTGPDEVVKVMNLIADMKKDGMYEGDEKVATDQVRTMHALAMSYLYMSDILRDVTDELRTRYEAQMESDEG